MPECTLSLVTLALLLVVQLATGELRNASRNGIIKVGLSKHHKRGQHNFDNLKKHAKMLGGLNGDIDLNDVQDMYYYGTIKAGTPNQGLTVNFDTGSSDLWVASRTMCKNNKRYCHNHNTYAHQKSKTYRRVGNQFRINYGSGYVSGFESQDDFNVADITVRGQIFGEATSMDEETAGSKFVGIFGLAYSSLSALHTNPPFLNMIKQGVVKEPVFAFYLNSMADNKTGSVGELVLGGLDPNHYAGEITYTPVVEKSYWTITVDSMKCGEQTIGESITAIPDSGTSLLIGPPAFTDPINEVLGGQYDQGVYMVDCNNIPNFPDVSVVISGKSFVLHPNDYILKMEDSSDETVCISTFVGMEEAPFFILGDVFMRSIYTVFDMGNDRVGFATAASYTG